MSILKVENLSVEFDGHQVLKDVNFVVNKGDILAIVGPNGAGKSVLFRALLGLIPYSGKVYLEKNAKVSYVPQKFNIERDIPLNVDEFLKFKTDNAEDIIKILKDVGLSDKSHDDFH